jgi:hypothetical protein
MEKKVIVFILIALIIGGLIGYELGVYTTIKAVANIAKGFLDEKMISDAIFQYKNNIADCFPPKI